MYGLENCRNFKIREQIQLSCTITAQSDIEKGTCLPSRRLSRRKEVQAQRLVASLEDGRRGDHSAGRVPVTNA